MMTMKNTKFVEICLLLNEDWIFVLQEDNKTSLKALYTGTFEEGDDDDEESYEGNEEDEESGELKIEIIQFDLLSIQMKMMIYPKVMFRLIQLKVFDQIFELFFLLFSFAESAKGEKRKRGDDNEQDDDAPPQKI